MTRIYFVIPLLFSACTDASSPMAKDPATAPGQSVDRFSATAGHLMVRDGSNGLPAANAPVDFDKSPFITRGLGPDGRHVAYYNFDVQPTAPAPIFVLFREGETTPVKGQLNIVDDVPGDADYNDFWQVRRVTVPKDYVANSVTSLAALGAADYPVTATDTIVNCPIVPVGSTATRRVGGGDAGLTMGWYRDKVVHYFNFAEASLTGASVPESDIFVSFNINPDKPGGGPASGFTTESGGAQTHNVIATLPGSPIYSPLWSVNVYDNSSFGNVTNLNSAMAAPILGKAVASVNCPVAEMN
jgi:hypothetical protein